MLAFEWTVERVAVAIQAFAASLAAIAAGAAWRSARASARAVREAQQDRRIERLRERRARFEPMRVALIAFREADVGSRWERFGEARLAVQTWLPLAEGHDFPQTTYVLSAINNETIHSDESREIIDNAIGEVEREIMRLDDEIAEHEAGR